MLDNAYAAWSQRKGANELWVSRTNTFSRGSLTFGTGKLHVWSLYFMTIVREGDSGVIMVPPYNGYWSGSNPSAFASLGNTKSNPKPCLHKTSSGDETV